MSAHAIQIGSVLPAQVRGRWVGVVGYLHQACEKDIERKVTTGTLHDACIRGESILLTITVDGEVVGAGVVTRTDISYGRHLFVQALGGVGMAAWLPDFVAYLDQVGVANGCPDGILFCGRPGWRRVLNRLGFREVLTTMRRGP